jgi:putative oxidoreductase
MKVFIRTNKELVGIAMLVIRLGLGILIFAHGAQKVLGAFGGPGLDATVDGMTKMLGIPPFLAYLSAFTELLGGIAMIFGILTRFFGIALTINMAVAVIGVHLKNGLLGPGGAEYPLSLGLMALAISIAGPGMLSLDHVLFKHKINEPKRFDVPAGKAQFASGKGD